LNCAISTSTSSSKFKTEKDWVSVDQWESHAAQLHLTYQFLLLKIKSFEAFECFEDAFSLTWGCLLDFPSNCMKFFPASKFQLIWDSLTQTQQQELFAKLGQRQDRPTCRFVSRAFKLRHTFQRSTSAETSASFGFKSTFKSDEGVFGGASLGKTVVQKKREKKERDSQLLNERVQALAEAKSESSLKEAVQKREEKQKRQMERNQKEIGSKIKQNLLSKRISEYKEARAQTAKAQNYDVYKTTEVELPSLLLEKQNDKSSKSIFHTQLKKES